MTEILSYIDRLKNCGLGKQKSLEFLEKFCELRQAESPYMWFCDNDVDCDNCKSRCSIWQKGYNTAKDKYGVLEAKEQHGVLTAKDEFGVLKGEEEND